LASHLTSLHSPLRAHSAANTVLYSPPIDAAEVHRTDASPDAGAASLGVSFVSKAEEHQLEHSDEPPPASSVTECLRAGKPLWPSFGTNTVIKGCAVLPRSSRNPELAATATERHPSPMPPFRRCAPPGITNHSELLPAISSKMGPPRCQLPP
jgi:hypothetical protein